MRRCMCGCLVMLLMMIVAVNGNAETIRIAIDLVEVAVDVDGGGEARFSGPALQRLNPVGAPDLPWQVMDVLLPPDVDVASVDVQLDGARWNALDGRFAIAPAPPEMSWQDGQPVIDWPSDRPLTDGRDTRVYGNDNGYPGMPVKLVATGKMRQWRLAQVAVALFRWNPTRRQLKQLIQGEIVVTFSRQTKLHASSVTAGLQSDPIATETVRQMAVNFSSQKSAYLKLSEKTIDGADTGLAEELSLADGSGTYVILTTAAIQAASTTLDDFAAHKTDQGFTVQVITESEWGGGTGDTAAENIRGWLQANYIDSGISHVLLIGDPDPADGDVPMKRTYPKAGYTAPTDYYYADLTGDWDLDGDLNYGEFDDDFGTGGVDRYWEVIVGRIPYYGIMADLDSILSRIIAYQTTPVEQTEWRKNLLLPMDDLGDWYPLSDYLGEDIRNDILGIIGWSSHRIYDSNMLGLDPPPETMPCTKDNVVDTWSGEPFGLVVWFTHGSATSAADVIDSYRVDELDDTHPAFTFQVSCNTAYPEVSNNLAYALLRQGAICTLGATRDSWSLSGHNIAGEATIEGMGYEYTKRITAMGMPAGKALNMLRQTIAPDSNYAGQWMNYVDCNIYGDPDTILYESPQPVHNLTQDRHYAVIQAAVDEAADGDEIVLDPGTYRGAGNFDINFYGVNLILRSINPDDPSVVAATVIDAMDEPRVFRFVNGETSDTLIQGITLTGATGSAIYARNASPSVSACVFRDNAGHGIYLYPGDMQIDNCSFLANTGGIYNSGGSPEIVDCTFTENSAYQGGGVYTTGGTPRVSGCVFIANAATSEGGGLYGNTSGERLLIEDCLFSGNRSQGSGGGLCVYNNTHLVNTIVIGNTAAVDGGGIMTYIGSPTLTNCTLVGNRANRGGGWAVQGSTTTMDNSILWGNQADTAGDQIALLAHPVTFFNTDFSGNASDIEGGQETIYIENTDSCSLTWLNGISDDPQFVDPGGWDDNGTPEDLTDDTWIAGDYHLTTGSPCIDAGSDAAVHLPALDMDGDPRSLDGDGNGTAAVDIGADEYSQTHFCESDVDTDGDVDGADLAQLASGAAAIDVSDFAADFGKAACE